jgi:hypothetical protein
VSANKRKKKEGNVDLQKAHIRWLISEAIVVLSCSDKMLLEVEGPVMVCGDFHG